MHRSPTANRSFLHRDRKSSLTTDKVIYATLDRLALRRATLPLQLVPFDDDSNDSKDAFEKTDKADREKRTTNRKAASRRPSFKVRSAASVQWKYRSRSGKVECVPKESSIDRNPGTGSERVPEKVVPEIEPVPLDALPKTAQSATCEGTKRIEDETKVELNVANDGERLENNARKTKKTKAKKIETDFAKCVLRSKDRRMKKCNLSSSMSSLKTNCQAESAGTDLKTSKFRSLSRDELKYLTISLPTNFVHVASATNSKLMREDRAVPVHEKKYATLTLIGERRGDTCDARIGRKTMVDQEMIGRGDEAYELAECRKVTERIEATAYVEIKKESSRRVGTYESGVGTRAGKVLSLEKSQGGPEVVKTDANGDDEKIYEPVSQFSTLLPRANSSFLWGNVAARSEGRWLVRNGPIAPDGVLENVDDYACEKYDDVGTFECFLQKDEYDDVGPPSLSNGLSIQILPGPLSQDEVYDDVMPPDYDSIKNFSSASTLEEDDYLIPGTIDRPASSTDDREDILQRTSRQDDRVSRTSSENQYLSINNEYSSLEDLHEQDIYDDVGLPSQERVNSLYAGSSAGSQLGSTSNGKESEWEDLDDAPPALPLPRRNGTCARGPDGQITPNKKKLGQRWSRKVRRQRSKASRRSSARSSDRTTHDHTSSDAASDGSNYETLDSSQPDDFSTDSEASEILPPQDPNVSNHYVNVMIQSQVPQICLEAPTRPTPPPPREASLTQTLGRRMKMLRRTWSITKGSLGRMRRRTSAESDVVLDDNNSAKDSNGGQHVTANNTDGRKYFSFKRHFRKSLTGLSTFYLENNVENGNSRNNDREKQVIYSNSNWYTEADRWKDNGQIRSMENSVDHYSVLDEEPLYQFYAAAAARVAFDSDSDGYEEVEDVTPTSATIDLAKSGHRTLWCQTPQVIHSNLLQRLTMEERRIQEAKFEILTSEASYLNSLRVLENEFLNNHELVNETLTPSESDKLFGGVSPVRMASEKLLAELESIWRDDPMLQGLPDLFLKHYEKCSGIYVKYCSNQVSMDIALKELSSRKGSKFSEVISRIETHPACQSLSLHSFLMLPMQRITRLPLLADAVLSKLSTDHRERLHWEKVLSTLSQIVAECNEGARAAGRQIEMEALARKLEYSTKVTPIALRDRYLVRSGTVVQISPKTDSEYKLTFGRKIHKTTLYLLLLTDYLLIAKPKMNSHDDSYTVMDNCKRNLVTLEPVADDSPLVGRHAMILTLLENHAGRLAEYVLTCENDTERERWFDAVSSPEQYSVGERLYESWDCPQVIARYSYSPGQPDELTLQPGDVINVLRKMADGWHYGEKLLDGEQGWFPGNYTEEIASEHVRARNLRQRHRFLTLIGSVLQHRTKQTLVMH